ncbi:T9SS type A sorting domain-containing protein [Pseudotenacibaculum sp. MALMAid0570]|uniref:T9SS type A sorting domain-containing protein n=1 Tax=Pseudotenacibaculum sp. MALMAid0570 TaxID=3143938 RepID=UPI0032E05724
MIKKVLFTLFLFTATLAFSQKSLTKLSAVPNPFVTETKINFNSDSNQTIVLNIKNVLGKTVYSRRFKIKKGKNSIPFSRNDLRSGMYIYTIQNSKELVSKRFVIK